MLSRTSWTSGFERSYIMTETMINLFLGRALREPRSPGLSPGRHGTEETGPGYTCLFVVVLDWANGKV